MLHTNFRANQSGSFGEDFFPYILTDNGRRTLEATILYAPQELLSQGSYKSRKIGQGQP